MVRRRIIPLVLGIFAALSIVAPVAHAAPVAVPITTQADSTTLAPHTALAPPQNCFTAYASIYTNFHGQYGDVNFRVNVYDAGAGATIYVQINNNPTEEYHADSRGFWNKTYVTYGDATVYVSIYRGSYWLCAGSDTTANPALASS